MIEVVEDGKAGVYRAKLKRVLVASNHLANALTTLCPRQSWWTWTREEAQVKGAPIYDVWIAWREAMDVSNELDDGKTCGQSEMVREVAT